jgi:hypothetical protein
MKNWLKCTAKRSGEPVYVSLDNAVSVYWSDRDKGTVSLHSSVVRKTRSPLKKSPRMF